MSDLKVLHIITSSSSFFDFTRIFTLFFARISYFQIFGVKEFNKTIIPFELVAIGYETGYAPTRLVGYLLFHIQRSLME